MNMPINESTQNLSSIEKSWRSPGPDTMRDHQVFFRVDKSLQWESGYHVSKGIVRPFNTNSLIELVDGKGMIVCKLFGLNHPRPDYYLETGIWQEQEKIVGITPRNDILTHSGIYFDFDHPEKSVISIEDIAHALAHICRFTGHTDYHYSVAQHSVLVSEIVPQEHALAALLHDAAEAYIGDVSRPLKRLLPDFKEIERRVEKAVFNRFGLTLPMHESIKKADNILLRTEQRDLMPNNGGDCWFTEDIKALDEKIWPLPVTMAKRQFLRRYYKLVGEIG